jgi:hypothetical protein
VSTDSGSLSAQTAENIAEVSLFLSIVFPCEIFKAVKSNRTYAAHDFARRVNLWSITVSNNNNFTSYRINIMAFLR